jgi:hypothetical protein|tara:strand:+ start:550 stop:2220 length:1671 start_codon:yes stop_codon:yes gene_type:complete
MAVNYTVEQVPISVNVNSVIADNDWDPAWLGSPPDGVVDPAPWSTFLQFKITPTDPSTHYVVAKEFTIGGYAPLYEAYSGWNTIGLNDDFSDDTLVFTKLYSANAETTSALGSPTTVSLPFGVNAVIILDNTNVYNYLEQNIGEPPINNTVTVIAALDANYPIGSNDILITLDIDGDAVEIPTVPPPTTLRITCELYGGDEGNTTYGSCPANVVSYLPTGFQAASQSTQFGGVGYQDSMWSWQTIETNDPHKATIEGTCVAGLDPIITNIHFTPFAIIPVDGYYVGRWWCDLIDPSTGDDHGYANASSNTFVLGSEWFGAINEPAPSVISGVDNYVGTSFSDCSASGQTYSEILTATGAIPDDWDNLSTSEPLHGGMGIKFSQDNPNVIVHTTGQPDGTITPWASWNYTTEHPNDYTMMPISLESGGGVLELMSTFENNGFTSSSNIDDGQYYSYWGPRIDLIDTRCHTALYDQSFGSGTWDISIAWALAGGWSQLLSGNAVMVDLKGLHGFQANSDVGNPSNIYEIVIKIRVSNDLLIEEDTDTVSWSSSIWIDQ